MSTNVEETIAELGEFLASQHPFAVLQFITGMMIDWTHRDRHRKPSEEEINAMWESYLDLLKGKIDERLASGSHSLSRQRRKRCPTYIFLGDKRREVANLLANMAPETALDFIVSVTTNWIFSIPVDYLHLLPVKVKKKNSQSVAEAIYHWLLGYCELWP